MRAFLLLLSVLFVGSCSNRTAETDISNDTALTYSSFDFALVGDNPYSDKTFERYLKLIDDINEAQPALPWVVHVGDLKSGIQSCSDEELTRRFELNQGFAAAFILTPGDNDWYDCVAEAAGGYDDNERLDFLRGLFYPEPGKTTGGTPMIVETQSSRADYPDFVENVLWQHDGVVFATVHLLGLTRAATDEEREARRIAAARAWIEEAFERARTSDARGLLLATQADPWTVWGLPFLLRQRCPECLEPRQGLEWLEQVLVEGSMAFGRPVVLAVGDTHIYRVDKPLYTEAGALVDNFTRVETFGFPDVHWIRVRVEPESPWVFSFHQQIVH